jgi:hypothetical protein
MSPNLQKIYHFMYAIEQVYSFSKEKRKQGGSPKVYTHTSFILFFIHMFLQGIFTFKTMARILQKNYSQYGFPQAPSRKTIRRRFQALPLVIMYLVPQIALYCYRKVCRKTFNIRCLFSDKSIFRAKGGLWHAKHMALGVVPHASIDTEATWAKSPYHGWRFGYSLLLLTNQKRFPVAVMADTASLDEASQLYCLLKPLYKWVGVIVGDAAYKVYAVIQKLYVQYNILLLTKVLVKSPTMQWYKNLIENTIAQLTYAKRKPSIEPAFALIKELFNLKYETQLPYKGKKYVIPFLLITAITIQIMALYNHCNQKHLGDSFEFRDLF